MKTLDEKQLMAVVGGIIRDPPQPPPQADVGQEHPWPPPQASLSEADPWPMPPKE